MRTLGESKYCSKNYHKTIEGKYRTKREQGVTRLLYVPVDVEIFLNLEHSDIVKFLVNGDGDVVIRKDTCHTS